MAVTQEMQVKVANWRQKAREGTLTMEEMKEAIQAMRQDRVGAAASSAASKERKSTAKAKKAPINSEDLLSELDGI